MKTFEEFIEALVDRAQAEIAHEHLRELKMFSSDPPLICGSRHFIQFNSGYTIGFADLDKLEAFRDSISEGIWNARTGTKAQSEEQKPETCITCGKEATWANGFSTTAGWMHFDCSAS